LLVTHTHARCSPRSRFGLRLRCIHVVDSVYTTGYFAFGWFSGYGYTPAFGWFGSGCTFPVAFLRILFTFVLLVTHVVTHGLGCAVVAFTGLRFTFTRGWLDWVIPVARVCAATLRLQFFPLAFIRILHCVCCGYSVLRTFPFILRLPVAVYAVHGSRGLRLHAHARFGTRLRLPHTDYRPGSVSGPRVAHRLRAFTCTGYYRVWLLLGWLRLPRLHLPHGYVLLRCSRFVWLPDTFTFTLRCCYYSCLLLVTVVTRLPSWLVALFTTSPVPGLFARTRTACVGLPRCARLVTAPVTLLLVVYVWLRLHLHCATFAMRCYAGLPFAVCGCVTPHLVAPCFAFTLRTFVGFTVYTLHCVYLLLRFLPVHGLGWFATVARTPHPRVAVYTHARCPSWLRVGYV